MFQQARGILRAMCFYFQKDENVIVHNSFPVRLRADVSARFSCFPLFGERALIS